MVNAITGPPNNYDFGLDFNYAVWTPSTVLSLVNVPWNNDYRDIVRFTNKAALNTYIDGLEPSGARIEKLSYVKPNTPIRVKVPINSAIKYNYLRASNPIQPVPGGDVKKDYYYFITDVRYLSPNTTELVVQLDVWQTFGYDVTFGTSYVERGHIGIANTNNFNNFGRDYLSIPEGFDLGNEYRVITKRSDDIMGMRSNGESFSVEIDVIVVSTVDLTADPGTVSAPKLVSASGNYLESGVSGASVYVWNSIDAFLAYMLSMQDFPWVTQGIISAAMMPRVSRYMPSFEYTPNSPTSMAGYVVAPKRFDYFPNWRDSTEINSAIPERYRHLKKFLTYPYMGIELTCYTGNSVVLKPEAWNNPHARLMERVTYTPPGRRVEFSPRGYNSDGRAPENFAGLPDSVADTYIYWKGVGDDYGDYLDVTVGITNFPTIPLVNNGQLGYLAANNSTINYQRQSADWSQQRSLAAAQTGYDQASKGLETAQALNSIAVNADQMQTQNVNRTQVGQAVVSATTGVVAGAAGGAMGGGGAGAAAGAGMAAINGAGQLLSAGIQASANDEAFGIRQAAMMGSLGANQSQGEFVRNTNKNLADWAARGDYANEIAGINAKVQDAAMIQPSVSGQFGGESINLANASVEVSLRWKLIDNATIRRIGEFWLRYGYKVNMPINSMPENMMVMTKFTYWKLTESYLQSSPMPETFKQAIRGIFEKGVTVWARPEYIGNTDYADNTPLGGISF